MDVAVDWIISQFGVRRKTHLVRVNVRSWPTEKLHLTGERLEVWQCNWVELVHDQVKDLIFFSNKDFSLVLARTQLRSGRGKIRVVEADLLHSLWLVDCVIPKHETFEFALHLINVDRLLGNILSMEALGASYFFNSRDFRDFSNGCHELWLLPLAFLQIQALKLLRVIDYAHQAWLELWLRLVLAQV